MAFVNWEERVISNDRGKRLVHYYLKDKLGFRFLAVVGREKSLRHMSYEISSRFSKMMTLATTSASCCSSSSNSSSLDLKWKSRREVIDWLVSIVSDSAPCAYLPMSDRFSDDEDVEPTTTISSAKGLSSGKMGHLSKEFSWLGAAWDCRKKRKHYRSFNRNGITISVHDFVYVMVDDYKRLVAYVEDLYEDAKTNKMVVVRWFHKVDEVGIVLPSSVNDREIFSSLCLQDFSVECIDGLAAVLSAQDFDKFQNEARYRSSSWEPYLCRRQIDNDDVKPFDITQVQGYWSQELLRFMYATPGTSLKLRLKITHGGSGNSNGDGLGERSRLNSDVVKDAHKSKSLRSVGSKAEKYTRTSLAPPLLRKELLRKKLLRQQKHLVPGCRVEVLSQDSGMRGCWFRCVVLKKHHDKVKVQYQDVQDADGTGNLEEWVLASRVASPDKLGIWYCGRPVVRPDPSQSNNKISCSFDMGSIVDAWWYDGWWEGIVIQKESDGKIRVYFPGEQQVSIFVSGDLRPSREWIGNKWNHIKDHQDVASSLLSNMDKVNHQDLFDNVEQTETQKKSFMAPCNPLSSIDQSVVEMDKGALVLNLSEFCHLGSLKWSSSGKRKRAHELGKRKLKCKRPCGSGSTGTSSSSQEELEAKFLVPRSLPIVDHDKCKIGGDPMLVAPITLCSSLVLSQ